MGFILGPILAALFVTAWEMFGTTFRSALAEQGSAAADPDKMSSRSGSRNTQRFTCEHGTSKLI